jgi:MFS transporter, FHS family, glucose/mannose:H+ symporter
MKANPLRFTLFFTVCTLSMFACTLSTFIMQAVSYFHVLATSAGTLESYQNLSLLVFLFILFPVILRLGYKYSLMIVIGIMVVISVILPIVNSYWMIKVYLIGLGLVFVSMKVIIYSTVPLAVANESRQAMFMSFLEFSWAFATLIGQWLMAYFLKQYPERWLYSTWIFAGVGIICITLWSLIKFDESAISKEAHTGIKTRLKYIIQLCKNRYVIAMIVVLFLANLTEMGFSAWLPGFYQQGFNLSDFLSVSVASFAMLATMAGRVMVIIVLKFLSFGKTLFLFYAFGLVLLVFVLFNIYPSTKPIQTLSGVPLMALLLLAFTFFMSPSTPILNFSILSRTAKEKHVLLMTLLTIIFAIASSIGARLIGQLIDYYGIIAGFKIATLIPLAILVVLIIPYEKFIQKGSVS